MNRSVKLTHAQLRRLVAGSDSENRELSFNGTFRCTESLTGADYQVTKLVELKASWDSTRRLGGHNAVFVSNKPINESRLGQRLLQEQNLVTQALWLTVGSQTQHGHWEAWHVSGTGIVPINYVRIIAPGMPVLGEPSIQRSHHIADERWSRLHGAIGNSINKVHNSHVMVVGAGRNGTAVLRQLANLGVRRFTIVDPDLVESSNLDASFLYQEKHVGQFKSIAAGEVLVDSHEDVCVTCSTRGIAAQTNFDASVQVDLIVSCVDNDSARQSVAKIANYHAIVHLDIGTGVTRVGRSDQNQIAGDARLFLPGEGCAQCVGNTAQFDPRPPQLAQLRQAVDPADWPEHGPAEWSRGEPAEWSRQRAGSLVTINAMTVSAGIQMWLDLLAGSLSSSFWQRLQWASNQGLIADSGPVGESSSCKICNLSH